jgi:hypothetical protein
MFVLAARQGLASVTAFSSPTAQQPNILNISSLVCEDYENDGNDENNNNNNNEQMRQNDTSYLST